MRDELPTGTVTFLFTDVEGSSDLVRSVGDSAFASARAEHRRILRDAFLAQGGVEIDTAGDGFFVAFETAGAAVRAAIAGQVSLAEHERAGSIEVRVRMGLHTAEPHLADDGYVGIGVHRAARICDAARGGQILISNATAGILEDAEVPGVELADLGTHQLKGLPREQRLFQVTVDGLPSQFGRPRTMEPAPVPGVGTFCMTDLAGHRHIIRSLGDEASAALTADYQATVSAALEANHGIVLERAGDTVLAVFTNAGDAIRAAAAVRAALSDFAWPQDCDVALSAALHSGRWSGNPEHTAAGTALYRLTRLLQLAEPGRILVSQTTAALLEGDRSVPTLRDLGEREPSPDDIGRVYELPATP